MKRVLIALALTAMIWAQEPAAVIKRTPGPPGGGVTDLIRLRYTTPSSIGDILGPQGFMISGNNGLHAVIVAGEPERVAQAEQLIKELDQPQATERRRTGDIEVTVYLIGATAKAESPHSLPADLANVAKQLHAIFPYGDYQLLDTSFMRTGAGQGASMDGYMPDFPSADPTRKPSYSIQYFIDPEISAAAPDLIRFRRFAFDARVPRGDVKLDTDLDVHEGQKVVIGKTTVDNAGSAIFLVLSAKELH